MAETTLTTPEGHEVGVTAFGDPMANRLVILCHPTPGAPMDPDPTVTDRWGVHLVGLERPGYGSTPARSTGASGIQDRARDVDALVQRIEQNADSISNAQLQRYGVIGWGAGGVLAAAIAARDPERVDRLALVGVPTPAKAERLARAAGARPIDAAALGLGDEDSDLERHLGLWNRVQRMLQEAGRQGDAGIRADADLFADSGWTEGLSRIAASTVLWLGERDPFVSEEDVEWWGERIPGAVAHRVRDSGPLTIAASWSKVLAHVAPEHGRIVESERDSGTVRLADVDAVHPDRAD